MSMHELKGALAKARVHQEHLKATTAHQQQLHADLEKRNRELQAEVAELKTNYEASNKGRRAQLDENVKLTASVNELKGQVAKMTAAAAADANEKARAAAAAAAKERAAKALEAADKETVE